MVSKKFVIENEQGLHMRPAGVLAKAVTKFESDVTIVFEDKKINAKSLLNIIGACIKCGSEIELVCEGPDEEAALAHATDVYKRQVFFLYTCPQDVLRMAEAGVPIKSVNIGGMAFKTGKTQITKAVSVDESDIAAFKKLHEMGIELEIRPVATDKKVDLMSKIEGIEG